MVKYFSDIFDIFSSIFTYKNINDVCERKMRNIKNGISLLQSVNFTFNYAKLNTTYESIASNFNTIYGKHFSRQAYVEKSRNIPMILYKQTFDKIVSYHNSKFPRPNGEDKLYPVDGTSSNNMTSGSKYNSNLNLCIYDVHSNIPIDISKYGDGNKNKEVKAFKTYISNNRDIFKNAIFICDRLYFTYDLLKFLIDGGFSFVIRVKGNGENIDPDIPFLKKPKDHKIISELRPKVRIVKSKRVYNKRVSSKKGKINHQTKMISVKNDYIIVTNLTDVEKYSDDTILDYYNFRWDIEVFFKLLKNKFKFQNVAEKDNNELSKMYYCELLTIYIGKIIENYYWEIEKNKIKPIENKTKKTKKIRKIKKITQYTRKINKSHLIEGIYNCVLPKLLMNNLNDDEFMSFIKNYVKIVQNAKDRHFPRVSKIPFSKWYIKAYLESSKYSKVINAIINNKVDKLNKNLKTLAKNIIKIANDNG